MPEAANHSLGLRLRHAYDGDDAAMDVVSPPEGLSSDAVIEKLKQLIIDRGLQSGDRLPTENRLALDFGVSRITVREATKVLRFLGILHSAPRRGLTIGNLDFSQLSRCLDFHLFITNYPREHLLRSRMVIELGVLPYVARRMGQDPELLPRLLAWTELPGVTSDPTIYFNADIAFHRELISASETAPLVFFDQLLRVFFARFREEVLGPEPAAMVRGVHMHRRIVLALKDGQVGIAQDLLREAFENYGPI
jgi:DNA-binding FadR family transcriptional regulator